MCVLMATGVRNDGQPGALVRQGGGAGAGAGVTKTIIKMVLTRMQ